VHVDERERLVGVFPRFFFLSELPAGAADGAQDIVVALLPAFIMWHGGSLH
jgi:hypothetical protein